jgi:hypothetical protein
MSARSSLHSGGLLVLLAACHSAPKQPEADPAQVKTLVEKMVNNVPTPGAVRQCTKADYRGVPTVTFRTLLQLAGEQLKSDPEHADWINPRALDADAFHAVATGDRHAAATVLAPAGWIVYKVDMVNAPIALGVKELKIGTIGARAMRFSTKTGLPDCVEVFFFQNDQAKSDWAIAQSNRTLIDPAVAKAMRDDLAAQFLTHAPRGQ